MPFVTNLTLSGASCQGVGVTFVADTMILASVTPLSRPIMTRTCMLLAALVTTTLAGATLAQTNQALQPTTGVDGGVIYQYDPRDRKSVVEGKSGDLGGRRIMKKKNTTKTHKHTHTYVTRAEPQRQQSTPTPD